jgi:hypothetical protein
MLLGLQALLLLIACSGGPGGQGSTGAAGQGAAGTGDIAGQGGTTGMAGQGGTTGTGGMAGQGGTTGTGGIAGQGGTTGTGGVAGLGGTGGVGGTTGTGGIAGQGGTTGTGGIAGQGGTGGAPVCPSGTPTFSVCVVSSADPQPFPQGATDPFITTAATVEAVGTGNAPAQCQSARVFGAARSSERWFQVRAANNVLWTIGLAGLGNAPVVRVGDQVTFALEYWATWPHANQGHVQLSDSGGTPLLWAGTSTYRLTLLSLVMGQPLCDLASPIQFCYGKRYDVMATVNGSAATLAPFSATSVGGYTLAVGAYEVGSPRSVSSGCFTDTFVIDPIVVAAVKTPVAAAN